MASAPVLADPSVMTAQERTNELVASVERDDLLAVLLVLGYCAEDEVNSRATPFGTSPLETALLYPTTRTPVRQLVAECLLQRGARADHLVSHMPPHALPAIESILKEWDHGGRDQATTSYDLCFAMDIYAVEEFLQQHGLGPDGPHDPPSARAAAPPAALAAPAPSSHTPSPRRRSPPQPHDPTSSTLYDSAHAEASTSSRRDGPSVGGPASRDDRRGSESAHRPSRAQSPRLEPRRRSRSPDRRRSSVRDDHEGRSPSPRRERGSPPRRASDHPRRPSPTRSYADERPARASRSERDLSPPSRKPGRGHDRHDRPPARRRDFEDEARTSMRRSPSPSLRALVAREPTPPPHELEPWLFVGGLPQTVAERWIYDHLTGIGITVDDIFLSYSYNQSARFAYVAVRRATDIDKACVSLRRVKLEGRAVLAKPFFDPATQSSVPQVSNSDYNRQYVGSERQASRPLDEHRLGVFVLHISRVAQPSHLLDFLRRCLRADEIGPIKLKPLGTNVVAFVLMRDAAPCRRAIRQLDGEVFCGQAVRVSWMELDKRDARPTDSHGTGSQHGDPINPAAVNSAPLKMNRYEQLAAAGAQKQADAPSPSVPTPAAAQTSTTSFTSSGSPTRARSAAASETPARTPAPSSRAPTSVSLGSLGVTQLQLHDDSTSSITAAHERDVDRLRSIGLSPDQLDAVQQLWRPIERAELASPDAQLVERSMDVKVDFGCVAKEDAALALALDGRKPAYPDDPARQARYSAFLKAQAGESKDYYTVFFAQLAEFNSVSAAFAERALATAEEARRGSGGTMDVDERVARREERI